MSGLIDYLQNLPLPSEVSLQHVFSLHWWLEYLLKAYESDPGHVVIELLCFAVIIWLLLRQSYDPKEERKLTKKEEDELIAEWEPEPLCPPLSEEDKIQKVNIVEGTVDAVTVVNGRKCLNFASKNFLGIASSERVKRVCKETIEKYGVGACGPRGFYGTADVHLELEKAIAEMYGVGDSILYSDGIATLASVIPAFSKARDLIICDESVNFGIQQGINLSRSNVLYFKHNDMDDLEKVLQDVKEKDLVRNSKKLNRRFIIVEGIYENVGDICPLDKVVELAHDYKYRVILDDSLALGVLGETGLGTAQHFGIPIEDVDIVAATLDCSIATVGGYCIGSSEVVSHQRLSGLGYCFSASSPFYVATAGTTALEIMREEPERITALRENARYLRSKLRKIGGIVVPGGNEEPIAHLRLTKSMGSYEADTTFWQIIEEKLLQKDIIVCVPKYVQFEKARTEPSLLVCVISNHTKAEIDNLCKHLSAEIADSLTL